MRTLIAEDDPTCSLILTSMLKPYGPTLAVADGTSVIREFTAALVKQQPYDLVCLDIMMPELDGQACLRCIREIERGFAREGRAGARILMITGVAKPETIFSAFRSQCDGYLVKPVDRARFVAQLGELELTPA